MFCRTLRLVPQVLPLCLIYIGKMRISNGLEADRKPSGIHALNHRDSQKISRLQGPIRIMGLELICGRLQLSSFLTVIFQPNND